MTKTANWFDFQDSWKQKNVDYAFAILKKQEVEKQRQKVQKCVERLTKILNPVIK